MRTRILPFVAAAAVFLAACSGSPTVAEVNGVPITADEVNALRADLSDDSIIDGGPFRADLGLLIINTILHTAAEDLFDVTGVTDPGRVDSRIGNPPELEVSVFAAIDENPQLSRRYAETIAELFIIREAVTDEIAGADLDELSRLNLFDQWLSTAAEAAEIEVGSQVGVWGGLGSGVLPPPP